ncbi:aldo/keto reductase [Halosimplex litoreum]|uniref:Aldo/keto reductase n=1 Tax=Halosimplex litoreum TaxID=1198301 RepID=A0A7U3WAZ8_9EURY|nr:aldo/keto reductase [Halosimplex litoreum]QPV64793.1 aldo/keto reductase [Halosimplex litoreum]
MPTDALPRIGLGTYSDDDREQWRDNVVTALEEGYRHVDTAQDYDNEPYVGQGVADAAVDREDVFLATKLAPGNLAYEDVLETAAASRDRLGIDAVDLLYVHWPADSYAPDETLRALDELVDEGVVRHVGLSNFTPALLDEARTHLDAPIAAHQVECHPLLQQDELRAYAREHDHWLVAYSPLAQGGVFDVPAVREVAEKHAVSPATVSLAWLLAKDNVAVVPKASGREHMRQNIAARDLELDEADLARIDDIEREHRVIDPAFGPWN